MNPCIGDALGVCGLKAIADICFLLRIYVFCRHILHGFTCQDPRSKSFFRDSRQEVYDFLLGVTDSESPSLIATLYLSSLVSFPFKNNVMFN